MTWRARARCTRPWEQESYDSLDFTLNAKCADAMVRTVIKEQLDACADITEALRSALVTVEGSENTFGDAQLSVDVIADNIMWDAVKSSAVVAWGASEEEPEAGPPGCHHHTSHVMHHIAPPRVSTQPPPS